MIWNKTFIIDMEKIKCNGCHYEHNCPMAEAGFDCFTVDVCPYIKDEQSRTSNPAKVVFTKNDLECLIEAIVNDCNMNKEDIVDVLEGVLTSVRGEGSETDNKKGIEECCLKVFDKEEDFVDLGLPSGTLWAKCNLGAEKETDFGHFFQWGDTQGYKNESEHQFNWEDYKFGNYNSLTKYNNTDRLTLLEPSDDSAVTATSGQASMPTKAQLEELVNNTNHEWVRLENGVNGMKFWKKGTEEPTDGNSYIFIPAAGNCGGGGRYGVGYWGNVWSASRYGSGAYGAWLMDFDAGGVGMGSSLRCSGYSVRGVLNK